MERHERREKQSGDQAQNLLTTIVNKQRDQFINDKMIESIVKGLEDRIITLINAGTEEVNNKTYLLLFLDVNLTQDLVEILYSITIDVIY